MSNGEPTTSFRQRLAAVWLTYRTRPLAWIVLLIYTAAAIGCLCLMRDNRPPFEQWIALAGNQDTSQLRSQRASWDAQHRRSASPGRYQPEPRMHFAPPEIQGTLRNGRKIDPKDVRTVEIWNEKHIPDDFWEPGAYPKVETIVAFSEPLSSTTLKRLLETFQLKALYFNRSERMTWEDLRAIGDEYSLEALGLDYVLALTETKTVRWPLRLRSLSINTYAALPVERFQEWKELEDLQTLHLSIPADLQPTLLVPEVVAELDSFPRRPTVFLDVPEGSDGQWAVAAQPHFRSIAVRPRTVSASRLNTAAYAFLLLLLPTAFGVYQLSVQSLQPLMLLTPGVMGPHRSLAIGLWIVGGLLSVAFAIYHQIAWPAALAVGASGMVTYGGLLRLILRGRGVDQAGFAHPIVAGLPILFLPTGWMIGMGVLRFYPTVAGEIDWFLRGQYPTFALLMLAVGIGCGWVIQQQLVFIRRRAEEVGIAEAPLSSIDFNGWSRLTARQQAKNQERMRNWHPMLRNRERRLQALSEHGPALTRSQRIRVWLCGLMLHPTDFTFALLLMCLVQFAVLLAMRSYGLGTAPDRGTVLIPATQMLMMLLIMPAFAIGSRRKWMAHELLFPLSRRDWMWDWFLIQTRMFLPAVWVLILLVIADALLGGSIRPTMRELFIGAAVVIYLLVAAWALSLQIVTWSNHFWWKATGVVLIFGVTVVALLIWLLPSDAAIDAFLSAPATIIGAVALAVAVLVGLVVWTWHRWQTWEVGNLN